MEKSTIKAKLKIPKPLDKFQNNLIKRLFKIPIKIVTFTEISSDTTTKKIVSRKSAFLFLESARKYTYYFHGKRMK